MKRFKWKKLIYITAFGLLGLQIAGCGKKEGNTTSQKEYVYVPEYQRLELEEGMSQAEFKGDTLYFRTGMYDEQTQTYVQQLGTLKIGEQTPKLAVMEIPENASVSGLHVNENGRVQMLVSTYLYEENADEADVGEAAENSEESAGSEAAEGEAEENSETADDSETAENSEAEAEDSDEAGEEEETQDTGESSAVLRENSESGYAMASYYGPVTVEEAYQEPVDITMELCEFDTDGKKVSAVDLKEALGEEGMYLQYLETDAEGNLYLGAEQKVWVLNPAGELLCELETEGWINNMFGTRDGQVFVVYYGEERVEIHPIDVQAKKVGDALEQLSVTDYANYNFVKGTGTDLLFSTDNVVYSYNFSDEAPVEILNWIDCDINSDNVTTFAQLEDGRIAAVTSSWGEDSYEAELVYLTKKKGSEVPEKKIMTLGTMSLGYDVRKQVIDFNKTNQEYRIEVKEYMSDVSMEGYEDAMKRMNTDIIGGNCPDLIDLSGGNIQKYAAKGVLEDLYPYIDKDEEINREDYLENVLAAFETEGKLYMLPTRVSISSIIGKQSDFGDRSSITLDEVIKLADEKQEGTELYEYATKDSILLWNTMMNMDRYVNWQTGECQLNGEEFMKALEFANRFDTEFSYEENGSSTPEKIREGKLLMMNVGISSVQEYQMYSAMFGEPIVFVGYPTGKENGSFIAGSGNEYGISSASAYKEGAWQFIRKNLTKEAQEKTAGSGSYGFPIMKSALEKQFALDMEEEYYEAPDGSKERQMKTSWGYDNFQVDIYAATQEEVDAVKQLLTGVENRYQYDEQMSQIITEEAKAFFEGQKTAKETADIIQSRVQIYVNENR